MDSIEKVAPKAPTAAAPATATTAVTGTPPLTVTAPGDAPSSAGIMNRAVTNPTATLPAALVVGQVLSDLPVVERKNENGTSQRGVIIDREFIAVELPDRIASGERITVQVAATTPQLKLKYISPDKAAAETVAQDPVALHGMLSSRAVLTDQGGAQQSITQRLIEGLLKKMRIDSDTLAGIRQIIATLAPDNDSAVPSTGARPATPPTAQSAPQIPFSKPTPVPAAVASLITLQPAEREPKELAAALREFNARDLRQALRAPAELREGRVERSPLPRHFADLENLVRKIDEYLTRRPAADRHATADHAARPGVSSRQAENSSEKPPTAKRAASGGSDRPTATGASTPTASTTNAAVPRHDATALPESLEKLTRTLAEIAARVSTTLKTEQEELRTMLKESLRLTADQETRIKRLLVAPQGEDPLQTLLRTVKEIEIPASDDRNPALQQFAKLIDDLRRSLEAILGRNNDTAPSFSDTRALTKLLTETLDKIYYQFGTPALEERLEPMPQLPTLFAQLPLPQQNALRAIEAQIRTLLQSVDQLSAIPLDPQLENTQLIQKQISTLLQVVRETLKQGTDTTVAMRGNVSPRDGREVPAERDAGLRFQALLRNFEDELKDLPGILSTPSSAVPPIREILGRMLGRIAHEIHGEIPSTPDPQHIAPAVLPVEQRAQLRTLATLIEDIVRRDLASTAPDRMQPAPHLNFESKKEIAELRNLLVRLSSFLPTPGNDAEQQMVELTGDLLLRLDHDNGKLAVATRDAMRRASDRIRRSFLGIASQDDPEQAQKMVLDRATLQNIERMFVGQETLQTMAPLMKRFGEPTLLLFPLLVQGFLSNLEIRSFDQPSPQANGPGRKHPSGDQTRFTRLALNVTLPHLGAIHVDIAFRPAELLMNLTFADQALANFAGERIGRLRTAMLAGGYQKISLTTLVKPPGDDLPAAAMQPDGAVLPRAGATTPSAKTTLPTLPSSALDVA